MANFLGADPTELERLAQGFANAGEHLRQIRADISNRVYSSMWEGGEADRFRANWNSRHAPSLLHGSATLESCANYLKAKAHEQVTASQATSGSVNWGQRISGVQNLGFRVNKEFSSWQKAIKGEIGKSPSAQHAWWNSLPSSEQQGMLASAPGSLLLLSGLPAPVRGEASKNAAETYASSIPFQQANYAVSGSVGIGKFVSVGASGSFVQTKNADGSYSVTLSGGLAGSAGLGTANAGAGVALGASDAVTYTFGSLRQAQTFENGLLKAATPHFSWQELLVPAVTLVNPLAGIVGTNVLMAGTAGAVAGQIGGYLSHYGSNMSSNVVSGTLTASANLSSPVQGAGGVNGSVAIQEGAAISYDTVNHTTTATLSASGNGFAQLGPFEGAAADNVQAGVTWGSDGKLASLNISGQYSIEGAISDNPLAGMQGKAGAFQVNVDLTNPQNQIAAMQFIKDLQDGNANGAAAACKEFYNNSEVVVQDGKVTGAHEGGVTTPVVSANYQSSTTTYTGTWVKPPNGAYVPI